MIKREIKEVGAAATWTVPTNVYKLTKVIVVGAGGSGGAGGGSNGWGGGGAGGYLEMEDLPVEPGDVIDVAIGAKGVGIVSGNGNAGGFSRFGPYRVNGGGGGEQGGAGAPDGAGVGGSGWDITYDPLTMFRGYYTAGPNGGAGQQGGNGYDGGEVAGYFENAGVKATNSGGGAGAFSFGENGGGGTDASAAGTTGDATGYGGGSGGGSTGSGDGSDGIVIIEYDEVV